ncbi:MULTISPECIES: PLP-dependent aminotransferase family protein [unclassified Rhizobium]|jgi:GntR family transcriptional regulator/MocR family aminotransferase|uniref:MocR-like pyridoxine biosynthesis transcription factor PdxR n=1 Tax=unclassified Rhizobium TaxID=2613769 RepID=UPI0006469F63|nr:MULTISPECIES: PLP-dependent aminotransferase family protein [unclassified Rhizobium]MBN8949211.1 PLP-dependent aminotransferase family protein [Rhizobium tropici]OJY75021.1 MAG: aminotransferase [Rhizobium sp. 60-20]RKD71003.1 GntR family transcriptional regulator/MocR family aminotransferase [Rhizobium sp. WW_1]
MVAVAQWQALDRTSGDLEGQVYRLMRDRILHGQMPAGQRVPSTRMMALSLGVARSTVVNAYDRLKAEGYLQSTTGAATRVAAFPTTSLSGQAAPPPPNLPRVTEFKTGGLYEPGVPDVSTFPHAAWARCLGARGRSLRVHDLGYRDHGGVQELREAILDHIAATRGVIARPEQILIMPSTGAAIGLLASALIRAGDPGGDVVWMEEPGYASAQAILRMAGASLVPVPCDTEGIDITRGTGPSPRLIYVTPSHQYPTGVTMSLSRRLALLEFARATGAIVLEDDYDSEFQYASRPIAALQGIDRGEVVAYVGTFSKTLAPGLRVAYAVVPSRLLAATEAAQRLRGAIVPVHIQAALADFMREGRFRAHLRHMNAIYAERMAATVEALNRHCGSWLDVGAGSGGLQLANWFRDVKTDDVATVRTINSNGFAVRPISALYLGPARPGLLLGIASMEAKAADAAAARIARLLAMVPVNA